MALSGSTDFTLTVGQVMDLALAEAGISGENETPTSEQYTIAMRYMNMAQLQLEVNDYPLWKREIYEFVPAASSYVTNNSLYYRCIKGHTSAASDEPGVGANSVLYWHEVDSTEAGSPSAWATSTAYTTSIEFTPPAKFYDFLTASVVQSTSSEIPIDIIKWNDYMTNQPSKRSSTVSAIPSFITFDNLLTKTGFIYPQPSNTFASVIRIMGVVRMDDADATTNNIDIQDRYLMVLVSQIAFHLCHHYQVDTEIYERCARRSAFFTKQYKKGNKEFTRPDSIRGLY